MPRPTAAEVVLEWTVDAVESHRHAVTNIGLPPTRRTSKYEPVIDEAGIRLADVELAGRLKRVGDRGAQDPPGTRTRTDSRDRAVEIVDVLERHERRHQMERPSANGSDAASATR